MNKTPTPEVPEWEKAFDAQFKGITLGFLSGDEGSPVFHNNKLEVPRLKNFIRSLLASQKHALLETVEEKEREIMVSPHVPPQGFVSKADRRCGDCFCTIQTDHTHREDELQIFSAIKETIKDLQDKTLGV